MPGRGLLSGGGGHGEAPGGPQSASILRLRLRPSRLGMRRQSRRVHASTVQQGNVLEGMECSDCTRVDVIACGWNSHIHTGRLWDGSLIDEADPFFCLFRAFLVILFGNSSNLLHYL